MKFSTYSFFSSICVTLLVFCSRMVASRPHASANHQQKLQDLMGDVEPMREDANFSPDLDEYSNLQYHLTPHRLEYGNGNGRFKPSLASWGAESRIRQNPSDWLNEADGETLYYANQQVDKRAMMRLGKRALMRLGKRAMFRLG